MQMKPRSEMYSIRECGLHHYRVTQDRLLSILPDTSCITHVIKLEKPELLLIEDIYPQKVLYSFKNSKVYVSELMLSYFYL